MAALRRRRMRATVALVAALGWTLGPWTPVALCAIDAVVEVVETTPKPSCHEAESEQPAQEDRSHRCCHDVTTSCCLEATAISGTFTANAKLQAPDATAAVVAALAPMSSLLAPPVLQPSAAAPPGAGRPPARTTVLRL